MSGDEQPFQLEINHTFAKKFNHNKKRQEVERLKSKYGDNPTEALLEESSSSSSMDELDNKDLDMNDPDFINVLTLIKTNNKRIYDKNNAFFETTDVQGDFSGDNKKRTRPIYLKDYQFQQAIEVEIQSSNTESDVKKDLSTHCYVGTGESNLEKQLKLSIIEATKNTVKDFDETVNGSDDKDEFFFPSKAPKYAKLINEVSDCGKLKKALENEQMDEKVINLMKGNEITLKTLSKESSKSGSQRVKIDEISDDENTKIDRIQSDAVSARRKDDRRIRKRNEKKLRKKEEKLNMLKEISILRSLKNDVNNEKIDEIIKIAGIYNHCNDISHKIDISTLIDEDFDEKKYDQIMQRFFNEDYYEDVNDNNEAEIKPLNCIDDEDADGGVEFGGFFDEDPNNHPLRLTKQMKKRLRKEEKKLKAKQKLQKSLSIDPTACDNHSNDNAVNGDNEALDTFTYRKTFSNDFGLTPEEILLCDDKELNQWCSLKKCIRYKDDDEELADYAIYAKKAKKTTKKAKILQSIQNATLQPEQSTNQPNKTNVELQ